MPSPRFRPGVAPANKNDDRTLALALGTILKHGGSYAKAAEELGITAEAVRQRARLAKSKGLKPRVWGGDRPVPTAEPAAPKPAKAAAPEPKTVLPEKVAQVLKRTPMSLSALAAHLGTSEPHLRDVISALVSGGFQVEKRSDGALVLNTDPPAAFMGGPVFEYVSRPDNTFVFGASGDQHFGSKYSRLDVIEDLYDKFAEAGVDRVFNTGNWVDGEARFNKNDLIVHGMDAQCRYLADKFPQRPGVKTYAVAGDDHEGWWAQREGVNVGRYAERCFRDVGRTDWINLGYMEAHVRLVNYNTGAVSILAVVHPGGGSSYALSYSIQKIIESLEGGEKPAVGLYGHYHKLWAGNIRSVWCVQTGCTQDQTPFMRKKKLGAHVGGAIIKLTQDPETGAITRCAPELIRYFNKGYYNDRWSMSGDVTLPDRGA